MTTPIIWATWLHSLVNLSTQAALQSLQYSNLHEKFQDLHIHERVGNSPNKLDTNMKQFRVFSDYCFVPNNLCGSETEIELFQFCFRFISLSFQLCFFCMSCLRRFRKWLPTLFNIQSKTVSVFLKNLS